MSTSSMLNWPPHLDRTPEDERERATKYEAKFRRTKKDVRKEMDNGVEADEWRVDDVSGSGGDPGVVIRWTKNGREHAAACDRYTKKRDNLRTLYLWLRETRKSGDRPVKTGRDQFAAAALPGEVDPNAEPAGPPPHEVLGVSEDAPDAVVRGAYRELEKKHHPDKADDPDPDRLQEIREAKEALIG